MTNYRITFHKVKLFFTEHFNNVTLDKANHFHVLRNNKKIGEQSKLHLAIKTIIDDFGENEALKNLMEKAYFLRKPDPYYRCAGIVFMEKYGVRIEMVFNETNAITESLRCK